MKVRWLWEQFPSDRYGEGKRNFPLPPAALFPSRRGVKEAAEERRHGSGDAKGYRALPYGGSVKGDSEIRKLRQYRDRTFRSTFQGKNLGRGGK